MHLSQKFWLRLSSPAANARPTPSRRSNGTGVNPVRAPNWMQVRNWLNELVNCNRQTPPAQPVAPVTAACRPNDLRKIIMWKSNLKTISTTNNYRALPAFVDTPPGILFEYLNLIFAISQKAISKDELLGNKKKRKTVAFWVSPFGFTIRIHHSNSPFGSTIRIHHSNSTLWSVNNIHELAEPSAVSADESSKSEPLDEVLGQNFWHRYLVEVPGRPIRND